MSPRPAAAPTDAATVLLLRSHPRFGIEVFMVRRHARSGFMANTYVFPGGKLDDADSGSDVIARTVGHDAASAARALAETESGTRALGLFVAGARETFEEAAILLADGVDPSALAGARQKGATGTPFAETLRALGATLQLDNLIPHSRWITPKREGRRYDARFFLALCPPDQKAEHDAHETTDGTWIAPEEALRRNREGSFAVPPPTLRMLDLLSPCESPAEALVEAASRPPPRVEPVLIEREGKVAVCLPGDPRHPIRERALPGPTCYVHDGKRWLAV